MAPRKHRIPTDLISLGKEPGGAHEILALKVFGDLLVPEGDVSLGWAKEHIEMLEG